jgi:ABC-type branched-subunit amino acid transport system substrate-binding protein
VLPWFTDDKAIVALLKKDSPSHRVYRYAPPSDEFIQKFRTKYGDDSRRPAANCYDGIKVMAKVMNEVGFERDAVRSALLQLSEYTGATGAFVVRADRERVGEKIESRELLGALN